MKVLFAATPLTGHVNPMLAIAKSMIARGDTVLMMTSAAFRLKVESAGLRFVPFQSEGDAEYRATDLPAGAERSRREFERRFLDAMPGQAQALRRLIAEEQPDVIVAASMFLGVLPLLLDERARPPIVVYNVTILFHDRPDLAPLGFGLTPARDAAEAARYAAMKSQVDIAFTDPVRAYADALLAREGLAGLPASLTQSIIVLPDAFIQATVPAFEYDYGNLPANLRFVGTFNPPGVGTAMPDWWQARDRNRRVVLVTQGTLANDDFGELLEPTLASLADRDDLLVIATMGGRSIDALGIRVPHNARVASFLPFTELVPQVDVLVTNGGYGSVSIALQAGVPIVSAGLTEDKAEVGARIAWSGSGLNLATNTPSQDQIRTAVLSVLDDPKFRERAAGIADSFADHDTMVEILSVIDQSARRPQSDLSTLRT